jgi:hypothetical protein
MERLDDILLFADLTGHSVVVDNKREGLSMWPAVDALRGSDLMTAKAAYL